MALTPKQQRFVDEYLIDLNATQAAERAGYKEPNKQGPRLLVNVGVQTAIAAATAARRARTKLSQDEVIDGLRHEANYRGKGATHAARVKAWEVLAKHLGLLTEKHEHGGANGGPIVIVHRIDDDGDPSAAAARPAANVPPQPS